MDCKCLSANTETGPIKCEKGQIEAVFEFVRYHLDVLKLSLAFNNSTRTDKISKTKHTHTHTNMYFVLGDLLSGDIYLALQF